MMKQPPHGHSTLRAADGCLSRGWPPSLGCIMSNQRVSNGIFQCYYSGLTKTSHNGVRIGPFRLQANPDHAGGLRGASFFTGAVALGVLGFAVLGAFFCREAGFRPAAWDFPSQSLGHWMPLLDQGAPRFNQSFSHTPGEIPRSSSSTPN